MDQYRAQHQTEARRTRRTRQLISANDAENVVGEHTNSESNTESPVAGQQNDNNPAVENGSGDKDIAVDSINTKPKKKRINGKVTRVSKSANVSRKKKVFCQFSIPLD